METLFETVLANGAMFRPPTSRPHNPRIMRVLVADRNGWLLESIACTFGARFNIQTATTHARCNQLLRRGRFDLVVVSDTLADGPGLQLLERLTRDSPNTLRVFATARSHLQSLQSSLGRFGLFRTLVYPLDPRSLLCVFRLADPGPELATNVASSRARSPGTGTRTSHPRRRPLPSRPHPVPAIVRPIAPTIVRARPPVRRARGVVRNGIAISMLAATAFYVHNWGLQAADALASPPEETQFIVAPSSSTIVRSTPPPPPVHATVAHPSPPEIIARGTPTPTQTFADPSTFGSEAYEPIFKN